MFSHIDQLARFFHRGKACIENRGRSADEGKDGAVVIRVGRVVEQKCAWDRLDLPGDGFELEGVPTLADVHHTLNDLVHGFSGRYSTSQRPGL